MTAGPPDGAAQRQTRARRRSLAAQLAAPARRFLSTQAGGAALLLVATVTALLWANSPWSAGYSALWQTEAAVSLAGVNLRDGVFAEAMASRVTWAVAGALVLGKFLGVGPTSWAAVRAGLECPFCARATGVTKELRDRFTDDLRYGFRHLPLVDVHPHAELAARAAVAAAAPRRFWEMHDLLLAHQDQLEYEDRAGYTAHLNLDGETFLRDLDGEETAARVPADVASAEASGVRRTPAFFTSTARHTGPHDTETLARALEAFRTRLDVPHGR